MEHNMKDKIMDLKALEENFKELNKQIADAKMEMQVKSTGYIEAACAQFFEQNPLVESVFWTQYTPFFNDGEACEFSVNDMYYTLEGDENADDDEGSITYTQKDLDKALEKMEVTKQYVADPYTWAENYKREYREKWGRDPYGSNHRPYPSTIEDSQERIDEIQEFLDKYPSETIEQIELSFNSLQKSIGLVDEDIMQAVYGDHVKVVVTREGTEIDEYDHD